MTTVEDIIDFCQKNDLLYKVAGHYLMAGGHVQKNVDMGVYRVNYAPDFQDVYYFKYDMRFDLKTREVYSFGSGEYDIRNHPNWGK